jgi:hypothetical protein
MMVNRHKYFRWTGRTARITFAYMVAFPALIGYIAYTTDVSGHNDGGKWATGLMTTGQIPSEREEEGRHDCGVLGVDKEG